MEQNIMDALKLLMSDSETHLGQILQKLSGGQFLTEQDCLETVRLFSELSRKQQDCRHALEEEGLGGAPCESLAQLESLLEERRRKEEQVSGLRAVRDTFLSLRAQEKHQAELERFQAPLRDLDDDGLLRLEEEGRLEAYRQFLRCAAAEQPDTAMIKSLTDLFEYQLPFALLAREVSLPDETAAPAERTPEETAGQVPQDAPPQPAEETVQPPAPESPADAVIPPAAAGLGETAPEADAPAAPEDPELCALLPVQRQEVSVSSFRSLLQRLPMESRIILPALSKLGTLTLDLLMEYSKIMEWDITQHNPIDFYNKLKESLQLMMDTRLIAGYDTPSGDTAYCLTEYAYTCLHKDAVRKGSLLNIPTHIYPHFKISIGSFRLIARSRLPASQILPILELNRRVAAYLRWVYEHAESLSLSKRAAWEICNSLSWAKAQTYTLGIPVPDMENKRCQVWNGTAGNPKGPLLFLAEKLEQECFQAPAFWFDGDMLYRRVQEDWIPLLPAAPDAGEGASAPAADSPSRAAAPLAGESPLPEPSQAKTPLKEAPPKETPPKETPPKETSPKEASPKETFSEKIPPEKSEKTPSETPARAEEAAASREAPEEVQVQGFDVDHHDAQESAKYLLDQQEPIRPEQLLLLTVRLLAESRFAEAAALAEVLAKAPGAAPWADPFYQALCQSLQVPGTLYQYSSSVINDQQRALPEEHPALRKLQQTMILSTLLRAMVFPSTAYDHDLYNNARMVVDSDAEPPVQGLVALLSEELKELSFRNDGLGFSPMVLNALASNGERQRQLAALQKKAAELKRTPTSTIGLTGLETCLKQMVGPASQVGRALSLVEANAQPRVGAVRAMLLEELGPAWLKFEDSCLEEYIDQCWNNVRKNDSHIKIKRLENDTPARRMCKKALTDRLAVIQGWLNLAEAEQGAKIQRSRDGYARILNRLRTMLAQLTEEKSADAWEAAGRSILRYAAQNLLRALGDCLPDGEGRFFYPLCLTPELILGENGENLIISELYGAPGLEPWGFLLRSIAAGPEDPEAILAQIDDYKSQRWFRNYGSEALLCVCLGREAPDRAADSQNAARAAEKDIKEFKSNVRLNRAYGKIREHEMETVFSVLELAKGFYFQRRNFASFQGFLTLLNTVLDREIRIRAAGYQRQVQELEEEFAGAELLEAIRKALTKQNFNSVDSYINQLQSGIRELPESERGPEPKVDFLAQFQDCEEGYFQECQDPKHRSANPARWGTHALESMERRYQHWSSPNEQKKGCDWLSRWILQKEGKDTAARVERLLTGLGFQVQNVEKEPRGKRGATYEVYLVSARKTSSGLKDYPHPVYKFGTDLSDPMYVVCLFGCKGESTLIRVMTNELQLNGPTIVLMDGSLTVAGRHEVARSFKANTSGQSPFLLIDRVLLLYLASLNEGDRQIAMLHCTLPYTFEVLYGSGSGAVPEEMFIGRVSEMNDLRSEQGPSLVYGGRQLGKTALLNRASKTIHDPQNQAFSFCVDVKDEGSAVLLEKTCRQLRKLGLLEEACPNLASLCDALQSAWEDQRIRRLQIFVDEADKLFEEFSREDYKALRPFIVLRDNTQHHVKFVFAGTHNVAATDKADTENNNLVHMGKPLCIEPLSVDDAIKLIRIPMSYLGFEIGDSQIELILSNTNSYPGLIHMFCNALIQSVCRDYDSYYSGGQARENPPYRISDEQMRAVFKEKDIRREIGTRVMATIKLNRKYRVLSCLLAHMIYEDQEGESGRLYGHSARELLDYNRRELQIPLLQDMPERDMEALLDEMTRMGILWKNRDSRQFRFRQQDFLNYIGTGEQVLELLLTEAAQEAKA